MEHVTVLYCVHYSVYLYTTHLVTRQQRESRSFCHSVQCSQIDRWVNEPVNEPLPLAEVLGEGGCCCLTCPGFHIDFFWHTPAFQPVCPISFYSGQTCSIKQYTDHHRLIKRVQYFLPRKKSQRSSWLERDVRVSGLWSLIQARLPT